MPGPAVTCNDVIVGKLHKPVCWGHVWVVVGMMEDHIGEPLPWQGESFSSGISLADNEDNSVFALPDVWTFFSVSGTTC